MRARSPVADAGSARSQIWYEPLNGQRVRRAIGWWIVGLTIAALAFVPPWHGTWPLSTVSMVAISLLAAAALASGIGLACDRTDRLEIDRAEQEVVVVRHGKRLAPRPLATLGPLEVMQRWWTVEQGPRRERARFVVVAQGARGATGETERLLVRSFRHSDDARREAKRLARAWNLPLVSFGGKPRPPEELARPLHVRRRGLTGSPLLIPPEWQVLIERDPGGERYRFRSLRVAPGLLVATVVGFLFPLLPLAYKPGFLGVVVDQFTSSVPYLMAGLFAAAAFLYAIALMLRSVLDSLWPGTLTIGPDAVRHRWRSLRIRQVEEVTAPDPIEIVGTRRSLRLPRTFCPPEAVAPLAREIERCIVEVANRSRSGAAAGNRPRGAWRSA